ncbi:MAG: galactose-1-phosphate uridylyltransferase [Armatimonadetes bacterium]|nr:galactose-1-phosphate uridylyltransferase [Armatimonadota bacterium]
MPQLRKDPVTREWVIIAKERSRRPSDFKHGEAEESQVSFKADCPFCPGNEEKTPKEVLAYRSRDTQPNTPGWWVRAVPNKFPALAIEGDLDRSGFGMYDMMNGIGAHEVIIETPYHDKTIATVTPQECLEVLWAYRDRHLDLQRDRRFKYILIFRNHGRIAGASLEHPHSQLIALPMIPMEVVHEVEGTERYYEWRDRCIYCDMLRQELSGGERILMENKMFVAFAPYASKYPFEILVMPKDHVQSYVDQSRDELESFAEILQGTLGKLSGALRNPPYNYMFHSAPCNSDRERMFHWHLDIVPRLTIAAGFEMGTGIYINVTAPEDAVKHLKETGSEG